MTHKRASAHGGRVIIAVARRDRTVTAKVGDAEMPVPLSKDAHVLVERVINLFAVKGSFEYGPLGTATATIPRSYLDFPQQFYER